MATNVCNCGKTHMICPDDGGLRHIASTQLVQELEVKGWHVVVNPKRTYYFEYDKQHPSYREREKIGMDEEDNILKVDVL